ncbi:unnamed protein product, partial [Ectocarpus sp. 12 AP-2014]
AEVCFPPSEPERGRGKRQRKRRGAHTQRSCGREFGRAWHVIRLQSKKSHPRFVRQRVQDRTPTPFRSRS